MTASHRELDRRSRMKEASRRLVPGQAGCRAAVFEARARELVAMVPRRTRRSSAASRRASTRDRLPQPGKASPGRAGPRAGQLGGVVVVDERPGGPARSALPTASMTTIRRQRTLLQHPKQPCQTAIYAQLPRWRTSSRWSSCAQPDSQIASFTSPSRVVAVPISSSVKVVQARRGTRSQMPSTGQVSAEESESLIYFR